MKTRLGKIKLHKQGADFCNRIQLSENVTVAPFSETYVKSYSSFGVSTHLQILQPTKGFIGQGLLVARTVLHASQKNMMISVRKEC